ncbi:phage exclusion protein Lit family protein [Thioclava sp. JE_KL1]|uniref:phage exclusion protein Lit family protein n=1 Tax=Thioclava sp. JE_KL1 TaxID=2651187 RepID=UPI00128E86C5|nr:phage exclusion protein Lit family protein [Thioclava sp. JE_KL1]MPQ95660.1 phage exclusion protein [Thioclava sp. JE_KL1]
MLRDLGYSCWSENAKSKGERPMIGEVRQDEIVQQAIRNLFVGSVPERALELSSLWNDLNLLFQLLPDNSKDGRLIMDAGSYRYIRFNHRVVRSFWIGAFVAWEGYRALAESPDFPRVDLTQFQELLATFEANLQNDLSDEASLPAGIPEPGTLPDINKDPQGRAASELSTIAVAWALLHEVRHIRHQREGTSASVDGDTREARHREEFSCDEFATRFILEKMQHYSEDKGDDLVLVRRKRETAIYFALFALTLLAKDSWSVSDSHPSVQDRIDAVCRLMGEDRDETAQAVAWAAFASLRELWPSAPIIAVCERCA